MKISVWGTVLVPAGLLMPLPSAAGQAAPASPQARSGDVSLCDLVEEALLATVPRPTPAVEYQEQEEQRAKIEQIKRKVQRLRDEGRCP